MPSKKWVLAALSVQTTCHPSSHYHLERMALDWRAILPLLGSSSISFFLSFMLMKVWLPFAPKRPGEVLLVVPVGLLQRLLIHRWQAIFVLLIVLVGSVPELDRPIILPGTQPAALVGLLVLMSLPLRYVFTDRSVGIGSTLPRPYRSFRRYTLREGRGLLAGNTTMFMEGRRGKNGTSPSMRLYLPTNRVPEVTRVLRRRLH
jgi:hypothetical protein